MNKFNLFVTLIIISPLLACQKREIKSNEFDNNTYINNFQLIQENTNNNTRVKLTSPMAIIDSITNDINILDSSIEIIKPNGIDFKIKSKNSTFNNYKNLISAYNNVSISLLDNEDSFIKTNSFNWDLNTSNINFNSPVYINFDNTTISSANGVYNIESGQLKINDNIFNRTIFNKEVGLIYQIKIVADMAKWFKDNNSLEFTSNDKQVETTINILSNK